MTTPPRTNALGLGLLLTSAAILMLEVSLTRIFSVVMWYHFAFFTISVALFGFAASGLTVHMIPRLFRLERALTAAYLAALALAIGVPICFKLFAINPGQHLITGVFVQVTESGLRLIDILRVAALFLSAVVPFYIGGLVIAVVFRFYGTRASRLYFYDLLGGGLGCLATVPVLDLVGGPGAMAVVGVLAAAGAFCFALASDQRPRQILASVVGLIAAALAVTNATTGWLDLKYYRGVEQHDVIYQDWNSFSRVAVREWDYPDSLLIEIDAASNTIVTRWDGDLAGMAHLRHDLIATQYALLEEPKVLIIGSGGGVDILTALLAGSRDITAVEVNPIIVDVMRNRYAEYSGRIYHQPGVRVVTDEARSYIRRSAERFDVIQAGYVDTYAATAAGAFSLTENTLYTVEAYRNYLDHLTPHGIISFQRYFEEDPQQGIRLVSVALAALRERGSADPARHIVVARKWRRATVLVKNSPFTSAEVEHLVDHCTEAGLDLVAAPGHYRDDIYGRLLSAADPQAVIDAYPLDISATRDDRPFFFYVIKPLEFWRGLFLRTGEFQHARAVFLLISLLIVVLVVSVLVLFMPALRDRRQFSRRTLPVLGYFAALGLGFMLVEIGLLQRLMLFLGHPTLALSVVLACLLMSAGLGSAWTGRIQLDDSGRWLRWLLILVIALVCVTAFAWPPILRALVGLTRPLRILLSIGLLCPIGFLLGTAFPLGVRRLDAWNPEMIPWAWAVNGVTSVLGSVLAMVIAINNGFTATLLVGVVVYGGAWWLAPRTAVES